MSLNFSAFGKTAPAATGAQEERPKSQIWVNIGVPLPMTNPETGKTEEVFVRLPLGLALDTMEPMTFRGGSKEWANMVQATNALLEELQKAAAVLKPGESQVVTGLTIQVKRIGEVEAPAAGENPLLAALAGTLKLAS